MTDIKKMAELCLEIDALKEELLDARDVAMGYATLCIEEGLVYPEECSDVREYINAQPETRSAIRLWNLIEDIYEDEDE